MNYCRNVNLKNIAIALFVWISFIIITFRTVKSAICGDGICESGAGEDALNCKADCFPDSPSKPIGQALHDLTDWLLGVAPAIAVILIIIGGFYYVTSIGDPQKAIKAKEIIRYAITGLVIIGLSYALIVVISKIFN